MNATFFPTLTTLIVSVCEVFSSSSAYCQVYIFAHFDVHHFYHHDTLKSSKICGVLFNSREENEMLCMPVV